MKSQSFYILPFRTHIFSILEWLFPFLGFAFFQTGKVCMHSSFCWELSKESDTTEWLNWTELKWLTAQHAWRVVCTTLVYIVCVRSSGKGLYSTCYCVPSSRTVLNPEGHESSQRISGFLCIASFTDITMKCKKKKKKKEINTSSRLTEYERVLLHLTMKRFRKFFWSLSRPKTRCTHMDSGLVRLDHL